MKRGSRLSSLWVFAAVMCLPISSVAADKPWSVRMADSVLMRDPNPLTLDSRGGGPRWDYTQGLVFQSLLDVWKRTQDERYWKYALTYYDTMVQADGTISLYSLDEYSLDRLASGKAIFLLRGRTGEAKYEKALRLLRSQYRTQPRTSDGGFWHKLRYPSQMWLDGLFMGGPFLAEYGMVFGDSEAHDEVARQLILMERHSRDARTGLLYHAWNEDRQQKWADPKTGCSAHFWGRAIGWYAMALVDVLDYLPADHKDRADVVAILARLAEAMVKVQDPKTGVWYQVVDLPHREGNYLESSVSCMLAYALLKGSRLGYLDSTYRAAALKAYAGILKEFVRVSPAGEVSVTKACRVAGLGPDPGSGRYRDGSFEYYVGEPQADNDPKAVGPFILASLEMESRP